MKRGVSIVEIMLATLIVGVCFASIFGSIAGGARVAERSEMAYLATQLARELIDEARTLRLDNPAVIASLSGEFTPDGHLLDSLDRLGVTQRRPDVMLPGGTFRYPPVYQRFRVRRQLVAVPKAPNDAVRQYVMTLEIRWEEEGVQGRQGPAASVYSAVLTVGLQ
jgi:type II secretory pathway pseudopilin PulG